MLPLSVVNYQWPYYNEIKDPCDVANLPVAAIQQNNHITRSDHWDT